MSLMAHTSCLIFWSCLKHQDSELLPLDVVKPDADTLSLVSVKKWSAPVENRVIKVRGHPKRRTENELSDFSQLWHDGCGETIIEAQNVDRNHSAEV
jgi:hypothetical protein